MNFVTEIEDGRFELEETNNYHRVPLAGGKFAIISAIYAPGKYPIRGWVEGASDSCSWTEDGMLSLGPTDGPYNLVAEPPKRKVMVEMTVDVEVESGAVIAASQHFPQGLAEVPVLIRLSPTPRPKTVRVNIKGEVELP